MADVQTTYFNLTQVEVGASEDTWGTKLNDNTGYLDALLARGSWFSTYGGTANALTLTTARPIKALVTGMALRFRATSANTGAATVAVDGLATKDLKTVTGAALPSGYIRTDVDTEMVFDGTNFIVNRVPERATTTTYSWTKLANGSLDISHYDGATASAWTTAYGSFYGPAATQTWTYEVAFVTNPPFVSGSVLTPADVASSVSVRTATTTACTFLPLIAASSGIGNTKGAYLTARGQWY